MPSTLARKNPIKRLFKILTLDATLQFTKRIHHTTLALVIIDEISYITAEFFGQIEWRLRDVLGEGQQEEPFGGLGIILMEDFFQLPPVVPPESLFTAVLKQETQQVNLDPHNVVLGPRTNGARLFTTFKKVELDQQMRAVYDTNHTAMLDQMRFPKSNQLRIPFHGKTTSQL